MAAQIRRSASVTDPVLHEPARHVWRFGERWATAAGERRVADARGLHDEHPHGDQEECRQCGVETIVEYEPRRLLRGGASQCPRGELRGQTLCVRQEAEAGIRAEQLL